MVVLDKVGILHESFIIVRVHTSSVGEPNRNRSLVGTNIQLSVLGILIVKVRHDVFIRSIVEATAVGSSVHFLLVADALPVENEGKDETGNSEANVSNGVGIAIVIVIEISSKAKLAFIDSKLGNIVMDIRWIIRIQGLSDHVIDDCTG